MENKPKKVSKYTNDDLKTMQNWSLERKLEVSLTRILEFSAHFNNKIYVLSL